VIHRNMNDSESNQSVGALDSLGHETNRSPSGYGDGSGQPSRAQSSWQSLWSRSPTAVGSEGATLLSHASSSTADTEAAYDHDHIKPRNAGNKTASGGDAYGTFFISQENADCDSEESEKEDFGVPNHRHPSVQAMLLTSATLGLMAVFTFVTSKPETDETLLFIVLDNVPTAFLFFFASEIIAQVSGKHVHTSFGGDPSSCKPWILHLADKPPRFADGRLWEYLGRTTLRSHPRCACRMLWHRDEWCRVHVLADEAVGADPDGRDGRGIRKCHHAASREDVYGLVHLGDLLKHHGTSRA
jgi:hypothetical protein